MTVAQFNFMDGGERNPSSLAYYNNLNVNFYSIVTFNSVYFFSANNGGSITWSPNFSSSTIYTGFRFVVGALANSYVIFYNVNNSIQTYLEFNSNGSVGLYSGSGSLLATSSASAIVTNTSIYMEIVAVISTTVGSISVYVNGNPTPLVSISNVNTAYDTSSLPITYIGYRSANSGQTFYVRDMYLHDGTGSAPFNALFGDVTCVLMEPNADVVANFTPVGNSTNYQNIDTSSPNGSDYNSGTTAGQTDTFSVSSLPTNTNHIFGIKLFDYSYKSDAGARSLAKTITSGTTTGTGMVNYLNGTVTVTEDLYIADPNTGSAFTSSSANSLIIGYKIIS